MHEQHMRRALALAKNGEGRVSPNPPVGCVLVKDGAVIAEGWHDRLGALHAEAMALAAARAAGVDPRGATAYVTLSPCTAHGRQPPCAPALIRAGVAEVLVAAPDPNPSNSAGADVLNAAGIPARAGLLREEAEYLARGFFKKIRAGLPHVTLKYAMTLDGKIAASTGDSKWVSGAASREAVQDMRSRHDAILTGIGTVLADDPLLNVRGAVWDARSATAVDGAGHRQPARVVVDSRCRFPVNAAMLDREKNPGGTIIVAVVAGLDEGRAPALRAAGAEVREFIANDGRVPLPALLTQLADDGMHMVMVESGGTLAASLLRDRLVDEVAAFVAPKLIGGADAPGFPANPVADMGLKRMADALPLRVRECRSVGDDILIIGQIAPGAKKDLPPQP